MSDIDKKACVWHGGRQISISDAQVALSEAWALFEKIAHHGPEPVSREALEWVIKTGARIRDTMKKEDLLGRFRTLVNNCKLVQASIVLLADPDAYKRYVISSHQSGIELPFGHGEILPILKSNIVLPTALIELRKTVHRDAITGSFEFTKEYCAHTMQSKILTEQPWYRFWRMLRNCWSHTGTFHFNDWDMKQLPVTWSGKTIDLHLEGKPVEYNLLSCEDLFLLLKDVESFISEKLN